MIPIQKKFNFSEPLTLFGFSVRNADTKIIFLTLFPCQLSESIRSNGLMSTKPSAAKKKMLSIFAKQKPKNTLSIVRCGVSLLLDHLVLPRWRSPHPLQNLRLKVSHKNSEISSKYSRMTKLCDKSFYKSFLTKTTQTTIKVQ